MPALKSGEVHIKSRFLFVFFFFLMEYLATLPANNWMGTAPLSVWVLPTPSPSPQLIFLSYLESIYFEISNLNLLQ